MKKLVYVLLGVSILADLYQVFKRVRHFNSETGEWEIVPWRYFRRKDPSQTFEDWNRTR